VVLFGSAVLLLHGLRESIGDVDLFVTREAWATLSIKHADRWKVRFPTAGDPPLLEWRAEKVVHAWVRWTSRDTWIQVEDAWRRREAVQGWPCVPLELVRRRNVLGEAMTSLERETRGAAGWDAVLLLTAPGEGQAALERAMAAMSLEAEHVTWLRDALKDVDVDTLRPNARSLVVRIRQLAGC
jgi:hypothetical protein